MRPTGWTRGRLPFRAVCRACHRPFHYSRLPSQPERVCCSGACALELGRVNLRKLPAPEVVANLYWVQRMSIPAIARKYGLQHQNVWLYMKRHGIKRRSKGSKAGGERNCIECGRPVFKILHKANGSRYGRRCRFHWNLHRAKLGRIYKRIRKGTAPEKYLYQSEAMIP
jgi:hypothetical protein